MQIIIKSRHVVLPKRLREFATAKFENLEKLLDRIQSIEIAVGESGARKVVDKSVVEVTLVTKMRRLHAEAHGPDIMTAVEAAVAKVEAQIRRIKGKAIARTRRSGGHVMADRIAATAALNGAGDAPVRIADRARAGITVKAAGAKAKKASANGRSTASNAGKVSKAVSGGKAAKGGAKRTAAARKVAAPSVKASAGATRSSARKTSAKRAGAGTKGRG